MDRRTDGVTEAFSIVASLFTIWAQSSILAENKEFDRFKEEEPVKEEIKQEIPEEPRLIVMAETKL